MSIQAVQEAEGQEYRNKTVINQRGATIVVNNSTDREEIKISQHAGSNISLNNLVNSELAVNNKQTKINNDSFETVGKDKNSFVGKDKVERVVEKSGKSNINLLLIEILNLEYSEVV